MGHEMGVLNEYITRWTIFKDLYWVIRVLYSIFHTGLLLQILKNNITVKLKLKLTWLCTRCR